MDNTKTIADMERLITTNGRDAQWTRENFGQLVAYFSNTRATTPSLKSLLDTIQ